MLSGIPQGSVLGTILFLMFIDDLDEGLTSRILKFADDSKIFRVVNGPEDRNALQEDLRRLSEWSEAWHVRFNVSKCKVMHLGPRNMVWKYSMGGQHLKVVREERDLGVIITNDFKVEAQCSAACVKANRMLGLIKRTLVNRSPTILTTLYKSLVRPHLEYSTAAWSPHYVKDREMLEKVQRRFMRMVLGLGDLGYGERLGVLGLMTLEERRNRSDMVEMFRVFRGLVIYLVIYLVRPNQSTFRVGLGPSGHQSMSETFFNFLKSSNLFLNVFTEPAEITSSLRLFHLFTIL